MSKVWVIGDSFSTNMTEDSWVTKLSKNKEVKNLSQNGISEYRIYKTFINNLESFSDNDIIILCHTNPYRIYLPDRVSYPTRKKQSHPNCDLVMGDVSRHGFLWKFISYIFVSYFFDEEYFLTQYNFFIRDMNHLIEDKKCKVLHVSGFDVKSPIISLYDLFENYRGNINHFNKQGNDLVVKRLLPYFELTISE